MYMYYRFFKKRFFEGILKLASFFTLCYESAWINVIFLQLGMYFRSFDCLFVS